MYTFKNTERNNKRANEFETKSLLFLMDLSGANSDINIFAIDCFNDVTGLDEAFAILWDVQAKNRQKMHPKLIGESLFTLFDNYMSKIEFYEFILFSPKFKSEYVKDNQCSEFRFNNFEDNIAKKIVNGLKAEFERVYLGSKFKQSEFNLFIKKLIFVQDSKPAFQYIKEITKFDGNIKPNEFYDKIFCEIRDKQSAKKNTEIEGVVIKDVAELLNLNRHLYARDIHTMIISRIIGYDFMSLRAIPFSFNAVISQLEVDEQRDTLLRCQEDLSKCYFNKRTKKNFWNVLGFFIRKFSVEPGSSIEDVTRDSEVKKELDVIGMERNSSLYLASIVKDGLQNDN